ncbi:ceramidase, partial [Obelidium mucronatum]
TSTLDWCEENYAVTQYIAEYYNTLSNISFLIVSVFGLKTLRELRVEELRDYLALGSLVVVGIGSTLFHGTMQFHAQILDEVPMIYVNSLAVLDRQENNALAILFTILATIISVMYYITKDNEFFGNCHASLVVVLIFAPPVQLKRLYQKFGKYHPEETFSNLWKVYWYSIITYLGGFGLWSFDNRHCLVLRSAKEKVGFPANALLEFHLWWHVFSALGGYGVVILLCWMRLIALGRWDVNAEWKWGWFPKLNSMKGKTE